MSDGTVSQINVYPIKSCGGIDLPAADLAEHGLAGDRMWQVVDAESAPVTQRQHKELTLVRPELTDDGLRLTGPHAEPITIGHPSDDDEPLAAKTLFKTPVDAVDAGDDAAEWFSSLVGEPVRLAGLASGRWQIPAGFGLNQQPLAFVDAAPLLVTTTASLAWLANAATEPFTMERFRPNIVVDNNEPWVEDTWAEFTIGDARLSLDAPWPRCAIPQIDQTTAERHNEPALALRAHRWCDDAPDHPEGARRFLEGSALFGIGCANSTVGTSIEIGQTVTVTATAAPLIAPPA